MTNSSPPRRKRDGTLRNALVDAGVEMLRERGPDGLSLRECAAKAGVSHAAPAYHFKNIAGLATSIAARGYQLFSKAMTDRLEAASPEPLDRLNAICHGYLDFAAEHPDLFLFIFSSRRFSEDDQDFKKHASGAYDILRSTCAPFVPDGTAPDEIEILVWSLVHGYAHLAMTRKKDNPDLGRSWPPLDALLKHLNKALEADN
ncbi:TetR/AcrR family transcriptional regulator [Labrenzia sp. VG12]|uniref:TetR/AcrR family transcriptional regulator n=1 Tax=Labrenzia sp. VG12 TaxID=2021862 RepID=UPI000B8C237B|nr:TetR/AcrR family transcriptional regulator [Labrenzia sp. VG12]ASP33093.1 TetR family transcriptional regulator [Labrenzia sp. VG12]